MAKIKRTIFYYDLKYMEGRNPQIKLEDAIKKALNLVVQLNKKNSSERFLVGDPVICMDEVKFESESNRVIGKLLAVRVDGLPQLYNLMNSETKDIDAAENEGVVDVSHFIIDFRKGIKLALEYNHTGAKIGQFEKYLNFILYKLPATDIQTEPILVKNIDSYVQRINRVSKITAKIHTDNLDVLNKHSPGLASSFLGAKNFDVDSYIELVLKFEYRKKKQTKEATKLAHDLVPKIQNNNDLVEAFDKLIITAEDDDKGNKIMDFDFISIKLKSIISVEIRKRYRTIISSDIFQKMKQENSDKFKVGF